MMGGVLLAAAPAGAGGWAVTTLDPLARAPVAGQAFTVGYTIRQHGQTPISVPDSAIVVVPAAGGPQLRFPGHPDGPAGHHVAEVTFPAAGTARWQVDQGAFAEQDLGPITVAGPTGGGAAAGGAGGDGASAARWVVRGVGLALTVAAAVAAAASVVSRRRARPAAVA